MKAGDSVNIGSSPRLWGVSAEKLRLRNLFRFIPTPVGSMRSISIWTRKNTVHPHACGEYPTAGIDSTDPAGSSPRLWGVC